MAPPYTAGRLVAVAEDGPGGPARVARSERLVDDDPQIGEALVEPELHRLDGAVPPAAKVVDDRPDAVLERLVRWIADQEDPFGLRLAHGSPI